MSVDVSVPRQPNQLQEECAHLIARRKSDAMRETPELLPGWHWYALGCTTHALRHFALGMFGPAVYGHVKLAYGGQHWVWHVSADEDGDRRFEAHGRGSFKTCLIECNKAAFRILREVD